MQYRVCHSKGSKYSIVMETAMVLSGVSTDVGLVGCTPLVVGLHSCSFCGFCPDVPSLQGTPLAVVGVAVYVMNLICSGYN